MHRPRNMKWRCISGNGFGVSLVFEVCEAEGIEDGRQGDPGCCPGGDGEPWKVLEQRWDKVGSACWTKVDCRQAQVWLERFRRSRRPGPHVSCRSLCSESPVGWQFRFLLHAATDSQASCRVIFICFLFVPGSGRAPRVLRVAPARSSGNRSARALPSAPTCSS